MGRGLQVSRGNVLEHLFLKRQIGDKTLQADMRLRQEVQALPWGAVRNGALSCFIVEAWTTAIFAAVLIF